MWKTNVHFYFRLAYTSFLVSLTCLFSSVFFAFNQACARASQIHHCLVMGQSIMVRLGPSLSIRYDTIRYSHTTLCGHPLPAPVNNWTRLAASRHTTAPFSHTRHLPRSPYSTTNFSPAEGRGLSWPERDNVFRSSSSSSSAAATTTEDDEFSLSSTFRHPSGDVSISWQSSLGGQDNTAGAWWHGYAAQLQ